MNKHKYIKLDDLPRNNKGIDWSNCIGKEIYYEYIDFSGFVKILDYNIKDGHLKIENNGKSFRIQTSRFTKCNFNVICGYESNEYLYEIGDIVKTETLNIKIIDRWCDKRKTYMVKCLNDGYEFPLTQDKIKTAKYCSVCINKVVIHGINDIFTTHPHYSIYFKNIEDAKKYSVKSSARINMICPDCGYEKPIQLGNFVNQGFGCNVCSDGISYPEKAISEILNFYNIKYIREKKFKWSKDKRYDFYLKEFNAIIEANGLQHKNGNFVKMKYGRNLQEEIENDIFKRNIAKENGIINYFEIDCEKSELDFILNNVIKSGLHKLLNIDFSMLDLTEINNKCSSSKCVEAWNLFNNGITNTKEISKLLNMNRATIIRYLNKGYKTGNCDYNAKEFRNIKPVVQLDLHFNAISEFNSMSAIRVNQTNLKNAIMNNLEYNGFRWMYKSDYDKLIQSQQGQSS